MMSWQWRSAIPIPLWRWCNMKLLPNDILRKLQAQDPEVLGHELSQEEELVITKFFTPDSSWTWYAVSASPDPDTGDVQFFGLVDGLEQELGYFWLSQLQKV